MSEQEEKKEIKRGLMQLVHYGASDIYISEETLRPHCMTCHHRHNVSSGCHSVAIGTTVHCNICEYINNILINGLPEQYLKQ